MEDRELLEMAAKACSLETWTDIDGNIYCGDPERRWNPLNDDADAFRIVSNLQLTVQFGNVVIGRVVQVSWDDNDCMQFVEDDAAMPRRAIVRAAAQIGRSMP